MCKSLRFGVLCQKDALEQKAGESGGVKSIRRDVHVFSLVLLCQAVACAVILNEVKKRPSGIRH